MDCLFHLHNTENIRHILSQNNAEKVVHTFVTFTPPENCTPRKQTNCWFLKSPNSSSSPVEPSYGDIYCHIQWLSVIFLLLLKLLLFLTFIAVHLSLSTNQSRQKVAYSESGSVQGFCLLRGSSLLLCQWENSMHIKDCGLHLLCMKSFVVIWQQISN